jgi:hypothetical protein
MIAFLKKYKAFIIGLIITRILTLIFIAKGVILIDNEEVLTNVLGFLFYWFLFSIFIHKLQYFKNNLKTVVKIIGLLAFLVGILVVDSKSDMPDNPITLFLLIVFYIGLIYVILPKFIEKYKWLILGTYGFALAIFTYFRMYSSSFEIYLQQKTELFLLFLIPIPIFISLWIYEQWKWFQSLKMEKAKAELEMLQAQINPHFFFNTLNNLYALTIKNSDKAPKVILKLSDMMRYTIYEGKKDLVPIKDEIEYLTNYIELHKIRYRNKVDIQFTHDIDNSIEVTPLLFIIFLENAFKHGLEKNHENGYIHMSLEGNSEQVIFSIKNNFIQESKGDNVGIGLTNLKRRLDLTYPKNYELNITTENNIYAANLKINLK